jgi:hypothetical protein
MHDTIDPKLLVLRDAECKTRERYERLSGLRGMADLGVVNASRNLWQEAVTALAKYEDGTTLLRNPP